MASIQRQAASGVRWTGTASASRALFMLIRLTVLARLLEKRDFGLVSMTAVVLGYAQAYVDLGLSSALIQKQERDASKLSTIFWLNVMAGLLFGTLLALCREPAAALMKEPALAELILVAALQLPISALGQQFEALFLRDLKFRLIAGVQIGTDALNTVVAIALALAGHGAWSLVIGTLAAACTSSLVLFALGVTKWPIRFTFRPREVKGHLRFGAYQLGNVNIGYLTSNVDTLLIGRLLGAEALGVYTVALRLTQMPRKYINPVISKVAFPVFARQKEDKRVVAESLLKLQRSLSYVNLPLIFGLLLVSPVLIPVLYGDKWTSAVPLVQVLCLAAVLAGVAGPTQIIRTALGHVRFNFHWAWISGGSQALAIWAVASMGLSAIVVARTAVSLALGLASIWITLRFINASLLEFLSTLRTPALTTAIMSGAVWIAMGASTGESPGLRLLLGVSVGAIVYTAAAALLDREFVLRNVRLLLGMKG